MKNTSKQSPPASASVEMLDALLVAGGVLDRIWSQLPDTPQTTLAISEIGHRLERLRHSLA